MVNQTCPKCKSEKIKEVITGGIEMTVHWDGEFVVREESTYEPNYDHSTFYCDNEECEMCGKEI